MSIFNKILRVSVIKTLRINFHYLPLKDAIKLPILVSRKVRLRSLNGSVKLLCKASTALIQLGFDTLGIVDWKNDYFIWENNGTISFSGRAILGAATKVCVLGGGYLSVGQNVTITGLSRLISGKKIVLGNGCLISWDVQIMDTDFHRIIEIPNSHYLNEPKEIIIEDHVWIGCKSLILKGSYIPKHSIIAAGTSIHNKFFDENSIYGGCPVKTIKTGISWNP